MKKLSLLLVFIAPSLWAEPTDTCKISVEKSPQGIEITNVSDKVFVRKGDNTDEDRQTYLFTPSNILEFVTNNEDTIILGGIKQDGITCFYQVLGDPEIKTENDDTHSLIAKKPRRNWIELTNMHKEKKLYFFGKDESKKTTFQILPCRGWEEEGLGQRLLFSFTIDGAEMDRVFKKESENKWHTDPIVINEGDSLDVLKLERIFVGQTRFMVVNEITFDKKSKPLLFYADHGSKFSEHLKDDILYPGYFDINLGKEELTSGHHDLVFKCTVLTSDGPKNVILNVPIDVNKKDSALLYDIIMVLIIILIVIIVLFLLRKFKIIGKIIRSLNKSNNPLPKNGEGKMTLEETGNKEAKENPQKTLIPQGDREQEDDTSQPIPTDVEMKDTRKRVIRTIIEKWNNNHPENEVDKSQYNLDSLLNTIANGYITPKAKTQLESFFLEYKIPIGKIIDKTAVANLITMVQNKGVQVGAANNNTSTSQTLDILSKQNKQLSEAKIALERINKDLESEKSTLQSQIKKKEGDLNMMIKANDNLVVEVENLTNQLKELQQQVNNQSQEHVTQLEKNIDDQKKEIAANEETISQQANAIADEKENVRKLTIQKENLDNKYKSLKEEYDKVNDKHQDEITKLKDAHKEASLRQKDKYEAQLKDKDEEIAKNQTAHETALNDLKKEYKAKLTQQQKESEAVLKKKEEDYQKAQDKLKKDQEAKVAKLNETIKELSVSVNVGRDQAIQNAENLLNRIATDLGIIDSSVNAVVNQTPIYVNTINNILSELQRTQEEFDDYKADDWNTPEKLQAQVLADMQDIFINALNRSGWMNNVARLLSYSRLPKLHDGATDGIDLPAKLEAHGISTAILERIYANMVNLLGIANMGVLVPAVLANNFDKECYEYKNGDTWIDKFFPEVSTRNYKGKVFDIVQVGYTVEGVIEKKPVVQYN